MGKYIDGSGLSHFMGILKGYFVPQTRTVNGHALSSNVTVTASDIGVASGAEVNQNAFSTVKVGSTNVAADSKTDTLELVGSNVTLTPDATNDKVTIGITASNVTTALGNTAVARATADASGNNIASTYANQNAFSRVMVGTTGVEADSTTDTLNLAGDNGISLTANSGSDTVTIALDSSVVKSVNGKPPSSLTGDVQISASELLAVSTEDGETVQHALDFLMGAKFDGVGFSYDTLSSDTLTTAHYALCSTEAATPTKTVSVPGFELVTGAWVAVKFQNANTGAVGSLQLRVDGATTGTAKAIKYRGANLGTAGQLGASRIYLFVYDGTNWEIVGDLDTDTNTKNTAGSTDSSSKLFLIGATSQAANPQTYSQDTAYVDTDGHLYSDSKQVVNLSGSQAITNKTYNGLSLTAATTGFTIAGGTTSKTLTVGNSYTLGAACAKGVDTSISAGSTSTNLPTTAAVVNYIGQVAGALVYKGAVNAESALLNVALKTGWFYIVGTAGSYGGKVCEAGDMIIVNTAGTYTTSSALGEKIDVIQTNIETLSNAEIDTLWAAA